MASLKTISLPHGTIPTQMFGNVNLQNAIMYVNENFAEMKSGVNEAISATNDALKEKAESDHNHDADYAALEHTHGMDAVTGLSAALDGKAELNHEHSQYLSSLPAHYHDVSGIQGLGEQLQAKAEKTHGHTTAQVEGLDTKLGVLASTSYVDQQVNSVGSSIKTISDQEVENYGAAKEGSGGAASADVPANTEAAPNNETVEQKNARVGTANRWARADHKHVFETETSVLTKLKHDGNGTDGAASFGTETKVPRIDHSHPLNFPDGKPTSSIAKDGMGEGGTAFFGATNSYADLGHSHPLNVTTIGIPSDVVKSTGTASLGSDETYARTDHVHKMPALTGEDIVYTGTTSVSSQIQTNVQSITTNTEELLDHETRIVRLEQGGGGGTVKKVDGVDPVNGNVQLNALTTTNYSTTLGSVYQAKSDKLTALNSNLNVDGTIPVSQVFDEDCDASCLAICTDGVFGHSSSGLSNSGIFGGDWPTLQKISQCFTVIGSGASAALKILISKISGSSSDTNKIVTTNANGELALNDAGNGLKVDSGVLSAKAGTNITVDSNGISVANISGTGFVKATNGTLGIPIPQEQPLTLPSGTGIVKSNGTALSASALTADEIPDLSATYAPASTVSFPGFGGSGSATTASHSDHNHNASYVKNNASHTSGGTAGSAAYLNVGEANGVQAYSEKLTALDTKLNASGQMDATNIVSTSSNKARLLGIAANGTTVSVREAIGTDMVTYDGTNAISDVIGQNGKIDASKVTVGSDTGFVKATNGVLSVPGDQPLMIPSGSGFVKSDGQVVSTQVKVSAATEVDFGNGVTNITTANLAQNAVTSVNGSAGAVTVMPFPGFGGSGSSATASHSDHTHEQYAKSEDLGDAAYGDIGTDVQAYSAPLTILDGNLNADGTIPSANVKDKDCTSGGKCFAYFDANKHLSHLTATTNINVPKANSIDGCFKHTTSQDGSITSSTLKYNAFGATSAPTAKKAVGFAANADTASLIDVATVDKQAAAVTDGTRMTYKNGQFVEDGNSYLTDDNVGDGLEYDHGTDVLSVKCKSDGGIIADSEGLSASGLVKVNTGITLAAGIRAVESGDTVSIYWTPITIGQDGTMTAGAEQHIDVSAPWY